MERARQKYRSPSNAELNAAPVPTQPNIDALPQPKTTAPIDLEALAKGYSAQSDAMAQAQGLATGPGLFVFISLSMPRATLQRLVDQAARAQASVFIRGLAGGSLACALVGDQLGSLARGTDCERIIARGMPHDGGLASS